MIANYETSTLNLVSKQIEQLPEKQTTKSTEDFKNILNVSTNSLVELKQVPPIKDSLADHTAEVSKPNMRQLIEIITGRTMHELYSDPESNWEKISREASEILYGVVGSNTDTRNWDLILKSDNIIETARSETEKMYGLKVDIVSEMDSESNLVAQYPVLKDKNNAIVRKLSGHVNKVEETLINFGAKKQTFPSDLKDKITFEGFQPEIKKLLISLSQDSQTIQNVALQTATDVISKRIENISADL